MTAARARLANARDDLAQEHLAGAVSAAYYAMLHAARAALSERDLHAKTHAGVWSSFTKTFVATGDFDRDLARRARRAQRLRELGDYEAEPPARDDAEELVATAGEFVEAVERMLA
jgi:uncharacterized protein (UPF0332 family)